MSEEKEKNVGEMFEELDKIIENLSAEDVPLEKAFSLYEEGVKLAAQCEKQIDTVEKKVLQLSDGGKTSEFS